MKIQTVSDLLFYVNHDRQQLIARTTRRRQLIIAAIALALSAALVAFGQTVEIYTERGVLTNKPTMIGSPGKPSDYQGKEGDASCGRMQQERNSRALLSTSEGAATVQPAPAPKVSIAEIVAQMWARDELRVPWREPTPLPMNRDRK